MNATDLAIGHLYNFVWNDTLLLARFEETHPGVIEPYYVFKTEGDPTAPGKLALSARFVAECVRPAGIETLV